jgi:hypothetical protein
MYHFITFAFSVIYLQKHFFQQHSSSAIPIENGVIGYPQVICSGHSIGVEIGTERPFEGRIYVKGESQLIECVRSFGGGSYGRSDPFDDDYQPHKSGYESTPVEYREKIGIELKFGDCNMRRQRTVR